MNTNNDEQRLALCLSGGGFRASFYHVGVLARMAELGLLKHVEVISTVSGGSIVGVAYYMKLKALLENHSDSEIKDQQYVDLVKELEDQFLFAVQKNLRMRTFANPFKNMHMALPSYSRSDAIGEIYEKYIYRNILDDEESEYRPIFKRKGKYLSIRDLLIHPDGDESFHPAEGNISRNHKVPILILNATSLNSGHNWYFSATSMGEVPPRNDNFRDIDKKDRYRRIRYDEIKSREQDFCLGKAVAASAGVPGLFPPMAVSKLYKDKRVQLVDGGVFDNQGISGALHEDHRCNHFVISDASGQSDADDNPDTGLFKVLGLSSSIMMGRVREEIVNYAEGTYKEQVSYTHLMRGVIAKNISAIGQKASEKSDEMMARNIMPSEKDFKVNSEMQYALAHIRTDLDSFTKVEAGCLAADAYLMSEKGLTNLCNTMNIDVNRLEGKNWRFSRFHRALENKNELILKHLKIASKKFFKPLLHMLGGTLGLANSIRLTLVSLPLLLCLGAIAYGIDLAFVSYFGESIIQTLVDYDSFVSFIEQIAPALYYLLIVYIVSAVADKFSEGSGDVLKWIIKWVFKGPAKLITGLFTRFILPFLGAIPVLIYVYTIDRYYIKITSDQFKELK